MLNCRFRCGDTLMELGSLVMALVQSEPAGVSGLAQRIGVSSATVSRWCGGKTRPRPEQEGQLRSLAASLQLSGRAVSGMEDMFPVAMTAEDRVRESLRTTLRNVRSILHTRGRLSSRHEALDELAKLLFAHVISIDTGGDGIDVIPSDSENVGETLRNVVEEAFLKFLPISLSTELGAADFAMKIRASENRLCGDLIRCFADTMPKSELLAAQRAGQLDILNDTFGQFLADSFVDEKELGQYLTPVNIVRSMVALGIKSLDRPLVESLCSFHEEAGLILDPSCGVGSFLTEALRMLYGIARQRLRPEELPQWTERVLTHNIVGIDKSERMIRLALTNFALFGVPAANLHLKNSLSRVGEDGAFCGSLAGRARLILTNPPFGAEYSGQDLADYQTANDWTSRPPKTIDSEILFIERYLEWLAPGGVLVAIVPDSILTNRGIFRDLRAAITPNVEVLSVISLPPVTFAAAGTTTKTSILHLRKTGALNTPRRTYFAVCTDVGYEVATKSSHRHKATKGEGQLPKIVEESNGQAPLQYGRQVRLEHQAARWDAIYHAGLPRPIQDRLNRTGTSDIVVGKVASLSRDRTDPRRSAAEKFRYVEISDVEASTCAVRYKWVISSEAPSRARKVIRPGDVLVSTVRPERRTVGVVGDNIQTGVCTTGFAVLRPEGIASGILARLLQSDFVNAQILRNNVGIAYPAIDEDCLLRILLPVNTSQLGPLAATSREVDVLRANLRYAEDSLAHQVLTTVKEWIG